MKRKQENLSRDLGWKYFDLKQKTSITYQFARYASELNYNKLPDEVIHSAKRSLLDAIGCAIGASEAPGKKIIEKTIRKIGGVPESTTFGSGIKTSAINATMLNSFLVRYLDCNDVGGGNHNSEAIPGLLAVAERENVSGSDFITALVISYELGERVSESIGGGEAWERNNWNIDCRVGLNMPPAIGKLMDLNEDEIANAIGISGPFAPSLGITDCHTEAMTMTKNLRFGFPAMHSVLACMLAKEGFTGFVRVIEGENGFSQMLFNNSIDFNKMIDFSGWKTLKVHHKVLCQNYTTQAHAQATLQLVKENDLKPEDIALVKIKTSLRDSKHVTAFPRKYPKDTENATHSAYYANAMVIAERALGPEQLRPEKFNDPVVLNLIDKIIVEPDPDLPEFGPGGSSEIVTVEGKHFIKKLDVPHGHLTNPLSDKELEDKFIRLCKPFINQEHIRQLIDKIWEIDKLKSIQELIKMLVY